MATSVRQTSLLTWEATLPFTKAENPGFQLLNSTIGPYAGWLKGSGLIACIPARLNPDGPAPLFQSNQITSFTVVGDPRAQRKARAAVVVPAGWPPTVTPGEMPPGVKITTPTFTTYHQCASQVVRRRIACSDPKTTKPLPASSSRQVLI